MKPILLLALCAVLSACATEVRSRNGTVLFRQSSDSARTSYTYSGGGERITLDIENHQPSKTIRAAGSVAGTVGTGLTSAIMAGFAGRVR